VECHVSQLTL